jgi:hypothetical protein
VTLILGASKPEGIYMCVDYRISAARVTLHDEASKCLTVHYPPLDAGTKALFGFTGAAILPDGTPTLTWLRETLRGQSEVPDVSMAHLHERLNRDWARLGQPLIINVLAIHEPDGRRFMGGFSNLRATAPTTPMRSFGYEIREIGDSYLFSNGSGAAVAWADAKLRKAHALLGVMPRKPEDFMKLLSIVNRRVAAGVNSVSPFCQVYFINATSQYSQTARAFVERGESVPFEMPFLLGGIDMTVMTNRLMEAVKTGELLSQASISDVTNEQIKRRE